MTGKAYAYQEVADLLKHTEKLKAHIKSVKGSSLDDYKASVFLHDGLGSSVEFPLTTTTLLRHLRANLRVLQARLAEAKAALA